MEKVYQVIHIYDVDGGFGDAVRQREVVATFDSKEMATAVIKGFAQPHVYDRPFTELECGELEVVEINVISTDDIKNRNVDITKEIDCWWINYKAPGMEEEEEYDPSRLLDAFKPV